MSQAILILLSVWFSASASADVSRIETDTRQLAAEVDTHRLTGTQAHRAAGAFLEQRLAEAGVTHVLPQAFPAVQLHPPKRQTTLTIPGPERTLEIQAIRPNVTAAPVLAEPIEAPLIYLGPGRLRDYAGRSVAGAIVVIDYDCGDRWQRAFARGAAAVIFLGDRDETQGPAKHAPVPINLPRFYANAGGPDAVIDLRSDYPHARLTQNEKQAFFPYVTAQNLIAFIPGTDPRNEAMVVTANTDTFGIVPTVSPGTRSAANVAGLLRLAEQLVADPPRRDVWLLFEDAGTQRHRGARMFYDAVTMSAEQHRALQAQHENEREQVVEALRALEERSAMSRDLRTRLQLTADSARADLDRQRQLLRRSRETTEATLADFTAQIEAWDQVRRWLNQGGAWDARPDEPDTLDQLVRNATQALQRRQQELSTALDYDAQHAALRNTLGRGGDVLPRVVLHIDLDLSDTGPTWSAVAGDWTHKLHEFRRPRGGTDDAGFHARVLNTLHALAERAPPTTLAHLDRKVLRDPSLASSYIPGRYVNAGAVAGGHGLYHVSLMTGHDARVRDGQPSDTPDRFNFDRFETQLEEALALIRLAADEPGLSLPPTFSPAVFTRRAGWDGQRATGNLVTRRVTGGLSENRPADGAFVALWPGDEGNPDLGWRALSRDAPADYQPFDLAPVNQHGRFDIVGLRSDIDDHLTTFAFDLDADGAVAAMPTQATIAHLHWKAIRVDLLAGPSFGLTWWGGEREDAGNTTLMRASSDASFRPNLSLTGRADRFRFWFLADRATETNVKLFDERGPVALGMNNTATEAEGVAAERFAHASAWATQTAMDLWRLNEGRLSALRQRGVTSPDLEVLHAEAGRAIDAGPTSVIVSTSAALRSAALSQQVYPRLRATMDDLVYAIVVLLLLSIPFAFAMERLAVGAASVYGRIAGFVAMFFGTFGLLYVSHPGFAIASTPVMIFLAFAIVLLSCLVIWVLVRRFQTELTAMQGRATSGDGGGMRGVGAAVGMGMSTMRRRPTRTILTATTVVMLTFTVLCFASVSRQVGVRSVGLGPTTEAMPDRAVMVRQLDASPMPAGTVDVLAELKHESNRGSAEHDWLQSWWRVPSSQDDRPITVARVDDGRSARLGGVLGIDPEMPAAWPAWDDALPTTSEVDLNNALGRGEVFLPADTMQQLGFTAGDTVLIDGRIQTVAGPTDAAALARLRQVDGQSWLPIDVAAQEAARGDAPPPTGEELAAVTVLRLSPYQVAVASNAVVEQLGGDLRSLTRWVDDGTEPNELAKAVAPLVRSPAWVAGHNGSERLTLGTVTQVDGLWRLVAPVLLGGLIIFGTLLGSISDRQKEIYTFSALGLGPRHVGMLFFAEAAVYAVVGGLGGQLLAQLVALAASWMSARGWIDPVSTNFASTQALFAIAVVMATVMVSAIYPAIRASRSANPGLARAWTMPGPEPAPHDHQIKLTFPFTVSAYDLTGVIAFLAEHFRQHADAGLGPFATSDVRIQRNEQGQLQLAAEVALAPLDLGVTQTLTLTGVPSDIPGVDEVAVQLYRQSGTKGDWVRANRVFIKRLRRTFLVWRTLPADTVEAYRMTTLEWLGEVGHDDFDEATPLRGGGVSLA